MVMDYANSIQAVALRVCKLAPSGIPLVGAQNAIVTSQFTRVSWTPEYETGEEISQKNAAGIECGYYKMADTLKRVNVEVAICQPQPELYEMFADGALLSAANDTPKTVTNKVLTSNVATLTTSAAHGYAIGDTVVVAGVDATFDGTQTVTAIPTTTTFSYAKTSANVVTAAATGTATKQGGVRGWAAPLNTEEPNANGLGLEVWTRAIISGRPASTYPYWRWVFPFVQTRMDGERVLENGNVANAFAGQGLANTSFGDGPNNDWPYTSTSAVQYARDTTAPTGLNDYSAVLA